MAQQSLARYINLTKQDTWLYFIFFSLLVIANQYFFLTYIYSDEIYYRSFGEQMAYDRIEKLLKVRDSLLWVSYMAVFIALIVKILFVSFCLNVGALLAGLKVEFRRIFQAVLVCEAVFIAASFIKTFYLMLIKADIPNLKYVQYFYPGSLANLVPQNNVPRWLTYPMQLGNVFEVLYWLLLAAFMRELTKKNYEKSFFLVAGSYGAGLLIWVVLVVFMSISFTR